MKLWIVLRFCGCGKFSPVLTDVGEESELWANEHSSLSLSG